MTGLTMAGRAMVRSALFAHVCAARARSLIMTRERQHVCGLRCRLDLKRTKRGGRSPSMTPHRQLTDGRGHELATRRSALLEMLMWRRACLCREVALLYGQQMLQEVNTSI